MIWGTYDVEPVRHVFRCISPTLTIPVSSRGGGLADATYRYEGRSEEVGHHRYRLIGVAEWMPPLHPTLVGRPDRTSATRADGGLDLEAEAARRRREWAQFSLLDGGPQWEPDEDDAV